jgi:hypothetical protein
MLALVLLLLLLLLLLVRTAHFAINPWYSYYTSFDMR